MRILPVILAVLSANVAYMVYRVTQLKPSRSHFEPFAAHEEKKDQSSQASRWAGHLGKAISFRTISPDPSHDLQPEEAAPFYQFHEFLESTFPLIHKSLTVEKVSELSLLYTWKGSDSSLPPVIFLAHQDVVPVTEDEWSHPPFSGAVVDGFVWGRGAIDCKPILMGVMEAVEQLLEQGHTPERTLIMAFGHDEEIGGVRGATAIVDLLKKRGVRAEFILDEGGAIVTKELVPFSTKPVALIGLAEKSFMNVRLRVETPTSELGHASTPPPHSSIGVLARAIARLEGCPATPTMEPVPRAMFEQLAGDMNPVGRFIFSNLWLFDKVLPFVLSALGSSTAAMVRTTQAVTMIDGGVLPNVLPQSATAYMNMRLLPSDTGVATLQRLRDVIGDERVEVTSISGLPTGGATSSMESYGFKLVGSTLASLYPDIAVTPFLVLGATDSRHYTPISDTVLRHSPYRLDKELLATLHGANERVSVEGYAEVVRFYTLLAKRATTVTAAKEGKGQH